MSAAGCDEIHIGLPADLVYACFNRIWRRNRKEAVFFLPDRPEYSVAGGDPPF
jgi:hypothetical protein